MSNFEHFEMEENQLNDLYDNIENTNTALNKQTQNITNTSGLIDNVLNTGYTGSVLGTIVKSETTGNQYYITDRGVAKQFPNTETLIATSGFNGCPTTVGSIPYDPTNETFRQENPYMSMGDPMTYQEINGMNVGQSCGNAGYNVYVDKKSPIVTEYTGCVSSNEFTFEQIGQGMTFDECKDLAGSSGYSSFSLNMQGENLLLSEGVGNTGIMTDYADIYGSGTAAFVKKAFETPPTTGTCYASKKIPTQFAKSSPVYTDIRNISLSECKNVNSSYSGNSTKNIVGILTRLFALSNTTDDISNTEYNFNEANGVTIRLESTTSGIWSLTDGNTTYAEWIPSSSNSSCFSGGNLDISSIKATGGSNCINYPNCASSSKSGNYTDIVQGYMDWAVKQGSGGVSEYQIWAENNGSSIGYSPNTCPACTSKNFSVSYTCGKNTNTKTVNVPPEENGGMIQFDCSESFWNCYGGLAVFDNGEVALLSGFFGSSGTTVQFKLAGPPSISGNLTPDSSVSKIMDTIITNGWGTTISANDSFNGISYNVLYNGGTLQPGKTVPSPSGNCYVKMSETGYLTINYIASSPSCNSSTKTGTNNIFLNEYSPNTITLDGKEVSNMYGVNVIKSKPYLDNLGKMGYVDDNLKLHPYPETMMPQFNSLNGQITSGTSINSVKNISQKQCQVECGGNTACNFYNYDDTLVGSSVCTHYSSIGATAQSTGISYDGKDYINKGFEKKPPERRNETGTCPFENTFNSIDTSEWNFYAKGELMRPWESCYQNRNNYLDNQINQLGEKNNNVKNELLKQDALTNNLLKQWNNSSTQFFKEVPKNNNLYNDIKRMKGKSLLSNTNEYNIQNAEGFNTLMTIDEMNNNSQELQQRNRYRNIFWSLLAITLIIMTLRLIHLYSK